MIQSEFRVGAVIENALKRAGMLALQKYGLSVTDVLGEADESILAVLKRHFVTDKEGYYEPRAVLATTNGKFSTGDLENIGSGFILGLSGHTLVGHDTHFLTELAPGTLIEVEGQIGTIGVVVNDVSATVVEDFGITVIGGQWTYGTTVGSYDSVAKVLTVATNPIASVRDVGKVLTFFDRSSPIANGFSAIITAYASNPSRYTISPWYPIPSLTRIANVTVIDWLLGGNTIKLLQGNEVLSPENCVVFDIANQRVIDMVPYEEFNRRLTMTKWLTGGSTWARYMQTQIELKSGTNAAPVGTLQVSAYWAPPRSNSMGSYAYISNKRIPEVEDHLTRRLLSIKTGQPMAERDERAEDLRELPVRDRQTVKDQDAVR